MSNDRNLTHFAPLATEFGYPFLTQVAFPHLAALLAAFFAVNMDVPPANAIDTLDGRTFEPRGVTPLDTGVFVIGCIPFLWATWEFWRRIAVGASFGTGKDAIVFDTADADEDQMRRFGGRRVLGKGALAVAYVLFAAAGVCDQRACTWPEQCAGADVFRLIDAYMPTGMGACRWSERKW